MDGELPPEDDGRPITMDGQVAKALATSALAARGHGLAAAPGGLGAPPGAMATPPGGLDAQAAATDGHVQPAVEAPTDASALALARTLLPTAPLPAIEYNLPVLEVQRYWLH